MITQERLNEFISSFDMGNTAFLNELEQYAIETNVPVIRPSVQSFLKFLLAAKQPERILEVGTAIGFSALFMCEYGPGNCHITTIENYKKRIPAAKENFKKAGREKQITLIEATISFLWMQRKGSIFIFCLMFLKGCLWEDCWCLTMCCMMGIFWNQDMP